MKRDALFFGAAQVVERLISFVLVALIARSMRPEEYALWAQATVVVGLMLPIVLMGMPTAYVKYAPQLGGAGQLRLVGLAYAFTAGAIAAAILVTQMFPEASSRSVFGASEFHAFLKWLSAILIGEAIFEITVAVLRADGQIKKLALYYLLKSLIRFSTVAAMLQSASSFELFFAAFALSQLVLVSVIAAFETLAFALRQRTNGAISLPLKEILGFALPLVPLAFATGASNFADRFLIVHFLGLRDLAPYALAGSLTGTASLLYGTLTFVLYPAVARHWAEGDHDALSTALTTTLRLYLHAIIPFCVGMAVMGPEVATLISGPGYRLSPVIYGLLALAVAVFGAYQLIVTVVFVGKGSTRILWFVVIAMLTGVAVGYVAVPSIGLLGAALGSLTSATILAALTAHDAARIVPLKWPLRTAIVVAARAAAVGAAAWLTIAWYGTWLGVAPLLWLAALVLLYIGLDVIDRENSLLRTLVTR